MSLKACRLLRVNLISTIVQWVGDLVWEQGFKSQRNTEQKYTRADCILSLPGWDQPEPYHKKSAVGHPGSTPVIIRKGSALSSGGPFYSIQTSTDTRPLKIRGEHNGMNNFLCKVPVPFLHPLRASAWTATSVLALLQPLSSTSCGGPSAQLQVELPGSTGCPGSPSVPTCPGPRLCMRQDFGECVCLEAGRPRALSQSLSVVLDCHLEYR